MVEALLIVAGGALLVPLLFAFAMLTGLGLAMWETWWLHPVWPLIAVPLGLPLIDYWQLFALNLFVSVLWIPPGIADYAKEDDTTKRNIGQIGRVFVAFIRPVMAYYVIRWAL